MVVNNIDSQSVCKRQVDSENKQSYIWKSNFVFVEGDWKWHVDIGSGRLCKLNSAKLNL